MLPEPLDPAPPERVQASPPTNRGATFKPDPLAAAEIEQLLDAISTRSSSGIRLRGIIGALYGGGLRLNEALTLAPRDFTNDALHVRTAKGGKSRRVGVDNVSAEMIRRWLDRRAALGVKGRGVPLFCTYETGREHGPIDPRYVRAALAKAADRAGIEKRVHPHGLRHSLAFDAAQRGVPMNAIQQQLGHSSLAITDRYVRHLNPADVIETFANRDWKTTT